MSDTVALLALLQTGGPAPIAADGPDWLLDLGTVQAGSLLPTLRLAVENAAAPPAGGLDVQFAVAADPEIRVFAPAGYAGIGPDSARGEVDAVLTATTPGVHLATITFHAQSVAADGSVTPLPDQVLTIREEVVGTLGAAAIPVADFATGLPAAQVLAAPVTLDGVDYARIQNLGAWTGSGTLDFAPDRATARHLGDAFLLATFQAVQADLSAAGAGKTIDVVGAGSGTLALARGDTALWSFASGGTAGGAAIHAAGQDTIRVTAVGADTLDDRLGADSLLPYAIYPFSVPRGGSVYDGHLSTATVELAGRGNTVTAEALVNLTVSGGAGQNHVVGGGGTNLFALTGVGNWIQAGAGQTTIIEQAGSLQGGRISGFHAGDQIRFQGFAADATLSDLGVGHYRVVDGAGHHEAFILSGVAHLAPGTDYVFG